MLFLGLITINFNLKRLTGLKSIIKVVSTVIKKGVERAETRYSISYLSGNANFINKAVRKHWHIENKLNWILDVIFKEDYYRVRKGHGAENMKTIRKIAYNTIKKDTSEKGSFKNKRKEAGWKIHLHYKY